jgi:hypothetical protein
VNRRAFVLLFFFFAYESAAPQFARAQDDLFSHADSSVRRAIERVAAEHPHSVRLAGSGNGRVEGAIVRAAGDSVSLDTDDGLRTMAVIDVDSVWVQRKSLATALGVIAVIPCAIFGALVGDAIGSDPDSNGGPGQGGRGALIGAALLGVPCGLLGAGVGYLIRPWRLEYARPG